MAKESGKNWIWFVYISGTPTQVANQKDGNFEINQSMIDTTTKSDSGWSANTPSTRTWSGSFSAIYDQTESTLTTLEAAARNQTRTQFRVTGEGGGNYIVYAYVDAAFSFSVDDVVTMDVTLQPDGAPTYAAS